MSDTTAYVVEMPITGFSVEAEERLRKIIASKAPLLKKALGTDEIAVVKTENAIRFPWFTLHGLEARLMPITV